ncbi:DUF4407 domain-containing protein [Mongoliitalea daihaiensis]|uniref:DUF4407 domain-containing protein n=1 Tax=Mongoliitalea daihaiensis TaxID=2782006 RepID=UPI001F45701A|nr:DUF4407 domain-containing protein [Mongoliitalea daihaiensis]UJP64917.1 DUF4407 domain-containing protein [Mongoliitalea daihaiensis]
MNKFQQFFLFASGYYVPLLKRCPSELQKVLGIGATVFLTALLATFSAGYAFWIIFQSPALAIAFAVVWGLMIFNLDRFIVASIRKKDKFWSELKVAFPRIVFAVLLAFVIAKPLELKVFEREIDRKLDEQRVELFKSSKIALEEGFQEVEQIREEKRQYDQELSSKLAFRDKLQAEYDLERFGVKSASSSGIVGLGTNAKKKEQQLDAAEKELATYQVYALSKKDSLDREIAALEELKSQELQKIQPSIDGFDGLGARLDALHAVGQEKPTIAFAGLMISVLLIALECAPILVKLLAPKGPYDELLALTEQGVSVFVQEKTVKLELGSERRIMKYQQEI